MVEISLSKALKEFKEIATILIDSQVPYDIIIIQACLVPCLLDKWFEVNTPREFQDHLDSLLV